MMAGRGLPGWMLQAAVCAAAIAGLGAIGRLGVRTWRAQADMEAARQLAGADEGQARLAAAAAVSWRPDDAEGWRLRAELTSFEAPREAEQFALRAVQLSPRDWQNWRTLGLARLQLGDLKGAREAFQRGVRFDHGFESHFQLGNLALLDGDEASFWREMKAALAVAPGQLVEYVLAEAVGQDPDGRKVAEILPPEPAFVNADAIGYFLGRGMVAPALAAWRLLRCGAADRETCRTEILYLTNSLAGLSFYGFPAGKAAAAPPAAAAPERDRNSGEEAETRLIGQALQVWNRAVDEGLLDQPRAGPGVCGDGAFTYAWSGPAFAWHSDHSAYTEVIPNGAPTGNAVQIDFDGQQQQYADLFEQIVAATAGAQYSLSYQSKRDAPGTQTGLVLRIWAGPSWHLMDLPAALGTNWTVNRSLVTVPAGVHRLKLVFTYSRPVGQILLHDPVSVADLEMHQVEQ